MENKLARYVEISIDIAEKIKSRDIKEGSKIKGRSLAAAEYNVSSETVRKSLALLKDQGVIEIHEKSGAIVLSRKHAIDFIRNFKKSYKNQNHISDIKEYLKQKKELDSKISQSLKYLQNSLTQSKGNIPFEHIHVTIHKDFNCVGKSIEEIDFFTKTGCTLFGIVSEGLIISSIQKEYIIKNEDILYFSGNNKQLDILLQNLKTL